LLFREPHISAQMSILQWLRAGCVGSYGTVTEPCAFTIKFPNTFNHYWYAAGFNMGESYWMSLRNPYQGVVAGDPLCAPYARPPAVSLMGFSSGATLSGLTNLCVTADEGGLNRKVSRIDLFIDGRLINTVTNLGPTEGNRIWVAIDGQTNSYVVADGDEIDTVAGQMASLINTNHTNVSAFAVHDRIELYQTALGVEGSNILYASGTALNTGTELTLCSFTASNRFIETVAPARQQLLVGGTVDPGDQLRTIVTRLDGVMVTNMVTAAGGETIQQLLQALQTEINSDTNLQVSTGCTMKYIYPFIAFPSETNEVFLVANTNHWESYQLHVDFDAIGLDAPDRDGNFTNNSSVMSARGMVFLSEGRAQVTAKIPLDTTLLDNGAHTLRIVAYDGTAVRTQGDLVMPFMVSNQAMRCSITNLIPFQSFLHGVQAPVKVDTFTAAGSVTAIQFYVEGRLHDTTNAAGACFLYDTTNFGVGRIAVQCRALADTGFAVWSDRIEIEVYRDSDADNLPDGWEWEQFQDEGLYTGADDPDGDNQSNEDEFAADTEPLDEDSFLHITSIIRTNGFTVTFPSSPERQYTIESNTSLTNDTNWIFVAPGPVQGNAGTTDWTPDISPTNPRTFYRIRTESP
ncbi:MAG: hypothetical protein AAF492_12215, partial [Verrucomicrobiota bacterium]